MTGEMSKQCRGKMKTNFIIVSHALTRWNVEGKIQGHTDLPLNREGRRMARLLGERLLRENINAVYTSDLRRAVETVLFFSCLSGIEIIKDIRLREGRSIQQERSDHYPTLPFYVEVEDEEDLRKRMVSVLSEIAWNNQGQKVLVVSHGGALEHFIHHVIASENSAHKYQGIRMALNRLSFSSGKWRCLGLNEIDYLQKNGVGKTT